MPELSSAPPAKLEPPQPEKKPLTESGGAYPFSILLSSCRQKESALVTLSGLRQPGLTPYIVQTDLGSKGLWWRTLIGHYQTPGEATQAKNALKLPNALVVKTPFANLLGQYGTETEAAEAAARFTPKDIFPYTVKGPGNSFQLMAGAFPSQQAAAVYQRELEAKGISTQVIQR
jgi:cell division septation protein DedD